LSFLNFCLFVFFLFGSLSHPAKVIEKKKAKVVEITLEKPKFPQFRLYVQKKAKFRQKKIKPQKNMLPPTYLTTYLPTKVVSLPYQAHHIPEWNWAPHVPPLLLNAKKKHHVPLGNFKFIWEFPKQKNIEPQFPFSI
jgi:hypothetical protein